MITTLPGLLLLAFLLEYAAASCEAGYYAAGDVCQPCSAGKWSDAGTHTSCTDCISGKYGALHFTHQTNAAKCLNCPSQRWSHLQLLLLTLRLRCWINRSLSLIKNAFLLQLGSKTHSPFWLILSQCTPKMSKNDQN